MGTSVLAFRRPDVYEDDHGWWTHGVFVTWDTLHSPDGEPWPFFLYPRLRTLLNEYGWVCKLAGTPFPVYGGYRSLDYQAVFHRAHNQQHPFGLALDILPIEDWTVARMSVYARRRWAMPDSQLTGIGLAPQWLHIDICPRRSRRIWRGSRVRPD